MCVTLLGVAIAGVLYFYGISFLHVKVRAWLVARDRPAPNANPPPHHAPTLTTPPTHTQCEAPLALWSLVAASLVVVVVVQLLVDDCRSVGVVAYCGRDEGDAALRAAKQDRVAAPSCWSWFTVLQTLVLSATAVAFVYGAFAVLSMFGRQRNASPGTEVCDKRLFDPLFFVILLVDLVLAVGAVLVLCMVALDLRCCSTCCGGGGAGGAEGGGVDADADADDAADGLLARDGRLGGGGGGSAVATASGGAAASPAP